MNNEWLPMETALKGKDDRILAYNKYGDVFITWWYEQPLKKDPKEAGWISDSCCDFGGLEEPIGWMPLPLVPESTREERAERDKEDEERIEKWQKTGRKLEEAFGDRK